MLACHTPQAHSVRGSCARVRACVRMYACVLSASSLVHCRVFFVFWGAFIKIGSVSCVFWFHVRFVCPSFFVVFVSRRRRRKSNGEEFGG